MPIPDPVLTRHYARLAAVLTQPHLSYLVCLRPSDSRRPLLRRNDLIDQMADHNSDDSDDESR